MNIQNIEAELRSLLGSTSANSQQPTLELKDITSLTRIKHLLDNLNVLKFSNARKTIPEVLSLNFAHKQILSTNPSDQLIEDYKEQINALKSRYENLSIYLQNICYMDKLEEIRTNELLNTLTKAIWPVEETFVLCRNTRFNIWGMENAKSDYFNIDNVFLLCENFHYSQSDYFELMTFDSYMKQSLQKSFKIDFSKSVFVSINFIIPQSDKYTESNVIFIFRVLPENEEKLRTLFTNPKTAEFNKLLLESLYKILQTHFNKKITRPFLLKKVNKIKRSFALYSFILFQLEALTNPRCSFAICRQMAEDDTNHHPNFVDVPAYDFKVAIITHSDKKLSISELNILSASLEALHNEFVSYFNHQVQLHLFEKVWEQGIAFFELTENAEVGYFYCNPVLFTEHFGKLPSYSLNLILNHYLNDHDLVSEVEKKLYLSISAGQSLIENAFEFSKYKVILNSYSVIESHKQNDGPRYSFILKLAPQRKNRITINFNFSAMEDSDMMTPVKSRRDLDELVNTEKSPSKPEMNTNAPGVVQSESGDN